MRGKGGKRKEKIPHTFGLLLVVFFFKVSFMFDLLFNGTQLLSTAVGHELILFLKKCS